MAEDGMNKKPLAPEKKPKEVSAPAPKPAAPKQSNSPKVGAPKLAAPKETNPFKGGKQIPGFEGMDKAWDNMTKSGQKVIDNRKKIMDQGFAPRKLDLKNLNAPYGKRNQEIWDKDKAEMQKFTDIASKAYKDNWIKNNPRPEKSLRPISQEEWESRAPDMLKTGLDHKNHSAIQARDFLFKNLKEQLGEGYDDEDIKEYANQYFNMSPEKAAKLERLYKESIPPKDFDSEAAEEAHMRESFAPDYDHETEGRYSTNEEEDERAKASELYGTDLNRGRIPDQEYDEDYERSWGPQEDEDEEEIKDQKPSTLNPQSEENRKYNNDDFPYIDKDEADANINHDIGGRGFEMPNGDFLGVELKDGKLYAGSPTNSGIMQDYYIDYDYDKSLNDNLEDLYTRIERGYPTEPSGMSKDEVESEPESKEELAPDKMHDDLYYGLMDDVDDGLHIHRKKGTNEWTLFDDNIGNPVELNKIKAKLNNIAKRYGYDYEIVPEKGWRSGMLDENGNDIEAPAYHIQFKKPVPQQLAWDKNNEPGSGVVTKELTDWVRNYLTKQVGPEFADAQARNLASDHKRADFYKHKMKEEWLKKQNGGR